MDLISKASDEELRRVGGEVEPSLPNTNKPNAVVKDRVATLAGSSVVRALAAD